jgi:hypothetical protein
VIAPFLLVHSHLREFKEKNMNQYDGKKGSAASTLIHYFKIAFKAGNLQWNGGNDAEVTSVIDAIIAAAVEELAANRLASEEQAADGAQRFGRIGGLNH